MSGAGPNPAGRRTPTGYMPQLDALRAIAALSVFITHWYPSGHPLKAYVDPGAHGVRLFFMLSGFLIIGILLRGRGEIESGRTTRGFLIRSFYIRRLLRLSPIYYLYIFAFLGLGLATGDGFERYVAWFLLYGQNVLFFLKEEVFNEYQEHLWTLAIEEQFYLMVPGALLFVPRRRVGALLVGLAALAPVYRASMMLFTGHEPFTARFLLPAQMDLLAMGGLLAMAAAGNDLREDGRPGRAARLERVGLLVGGPLLTGVIALEVMGTRFGERYPWADAARFVVENSVLGLFLFWLLGRASRGFGGAVGRVLELRPLVFLGTISYGLYVYHLKVPALLTQGLEKLGVGLPRAVSLRVLIFAAVAIAAAVASWYLIEKPINGFKSRFPYKPSAGAAAASGV